MSLALVIKNTILVILIILIGHFMVKNILLEKTTPTKPNAKPDAKPADKPEAKLESKPQDASAPIDSIVSKPSNDVQPVQGGLDKAKEELLKFIDDDNDNDDDNLDDYFTKTTTDGTLPAPLTPFNTKMGENPLPLNTTCDQTVQQLPAASTIPAIPAIPATINTINTTKSLAVVNEYENESTMNGGQLFGGLGAFDAFDSKYGAL